MIQSLAENMLKDNGEGSGLTSEAAANGIGKGLALSKLPSSTQ